MRMEETKIRAVFLAILLCVSGLSLVAIGQRRSSATWSCEAPYQTPTYARPADDSVALSTLIDAAGYAGASNSDWVDLAAGNFCGGPEKELVLIKNKHSNFSILRGPVPYAVGTGDLISNSAHPWRTVAAANLDGGPYDEIVAVRKVTAAGVPDLIVTKANRTCDLSSVVASAQIGNEANSDWIDAAVGRFDGTGRMQIALLKPKHSNVVLVNFTAPGTLTVSSSFDLDSNPAGKWKALAAGDIDGDGIDELIAARQINSNATSTVLVYKWSSSGFHLFTSSKFGNNGNSDWTDATVGDFNGDGRKAIVLVKNKHSNFVVLDLPRDTTNLRVLSTADLDSAEGQEWRGLAATDWLAGADEGAAELVAVRKATGNYRMDLFIYGNPFHRVARDTGLERNKEQWDQPRDATVAQMKQWLLDTHTNTLGWTLIEPGDYNKLVEFLDNTKNFCVDGKQLRVIVTPDNPNSNLDVCALPQNSSITRSWNELDYFPNRANGLFDKCSKQVQVEGPGRTPLFQNVKCDYCRDYLGWSSLIGRLAQDYPHVVGMGMDEFLFHVDKKFTEDYIAEMQSRMRSQSPWLNFAPSHYWGDDDDKFIGKKFPDFLHGVDTLFMFFRNNKQGTGPCTNCGHSGHDHGCLEGVCAEATIPNAPGEFAEVAGLLPAGRKLQGAIYFARHGNLGEPSVRYDYDLATLILNTPWLGGAMVYSMQTRPESMPPCTEADTFTDKYCALRKAFGAGAQSVTHTDLINASPGSPVLAGNPFGYVFLSQGVQNVVYRAASGAGYELWRTANRAGHSDLTALGQSPRPAGDLSAYLDPGAGLQVVLFRGTDAKVHSLYWTTGAVGHDDLSGAAHAPLAAGNPFGYFTTSDNYNHVIYRSANNHLNELYWTGTGAVGHGDLTALASAPNALGDPSPYVDTARRTNVVPYRGSDGHIHSLYWTTGAVGHDNLTSVAGSPLAAGDPFGYYTAHNDSHQIVYRAANGHLYELWCVGRNAVTFWDLSAISGAAPAASDPVGYYSPVTNTKHIFYRSADGYLHEIFWTPGGGKPMDRNLTLLAQAPLAVGKPTAYFLAADASHHVVYRGTDNRLHELRWIR
ncbi:MAG TPA: FG-GAP-like repeat-containing protein [Pyrinomonadaceae bacterium]|nr:FG-GAP-like repeat-containing protein [Pyrinomonadaceae bacterium]